MKGGVSITLARAESFGYHEHIKPGMVGCTLRIRTLQQLTRGSAKKAQKSAISKTACWDGDQA